MPSRSPDRRPPALLAGVAAALVVACAGLAGAVAADAAQPAAGRRGVLRACADPNNLPFSNRRGEGFENRLLELVAAELGAELEYTWRPQRRGFLRETLRAGLCDVVAGLPTASDLALVTAPYYRSTYVFVQSPEGPTVASFDDAALHHLRVGVQMIGDDYANAPPAHALARRGVIDNVRGYLVYGDYRDESPPARIVDAVAAGEVDVAVVWGPLAGYFAPLAGERHGRTLTLTPVSPQIDLPFLPFVFDVSMAVRRGDEALRDRLEAALERRRSDVDAILAAYRVPRLDPRRDGGAGGGA